MHISLLLWRAGLLALCWLMAGLVLSGCASPEPKIVTVAVLPDPPPIPAECKALGKGPLLPKLGNAKGEDVPLSRIEDAWLEAKLSLKLDLVSKRRCLCWLVASHGHETDIAETAGVCREGSPIENSGPRP